MENDNDILVGDGIVKAIFLNGGISGNTTVIVDVNNLFGKKGLQRKKTEIRTGAQETNELCCGKIR